MAGTYAKYAGLGGGGGGGISSVTASGPLSSSGGPTPNISIQQASGSQGGFLSSADWATFNSKQPSGSYLTSVTGTAPIVSSGGSTPAISMAAANTSTNGYLSSVICTRLYVPLLPLVSTAMLL